jgi:hypothetical protein
LKKITIYHKDAKKIVFKPLETNTYVFDYEKDKSTATHLIENFSMVNWDYLDAIYGDKNIYSTPRDLLNLIMAEFIKFLNPKLLRKPIYPIAMNIKAQKIMD